jgi:lysozyme
MSAVMDRIYYAKPRCRLEEGKKRLPYNDATGKTVTCRPHGNLSIGEGTNLEGGLYDNEIEFIFDNRIRIAAAEISGYWWMAGIDEIRASALVDLCFNEGLPHFLHFVNMLGAIGKKDWKTAHDELLNSEAARKDPKRYQNLARILLSGEA